MILQVIYNRRFPTEQQTTLEAFLTYLEIEYKLHPLNIYDLKLISKNEDPAIIFDPELEKTIKSFNKDKQVFILPAPELLVQRKENKEHREQAFLIGQSIKQYLARKELKTIQDVLLLVEEQERVLILEDNKIYLSDEVNSSKAISIYEALAIKSLTEVLHINIIEVKERKKS